MFIPSTVIGNFSWLLVFCLILLANFSKFLLLLTICGGGDKKFYDRLNVANVRLSLNDKLVFWWTYVLRIYVHMYIYSKIGKI